MVVGKEPAGIWYLAVLVLHYPAMRSALLPLVLLTLCLSGCASAPEQVAEQSVPELNLNLPSPGCDCEQPEASDVTFLEKGLEALHAADYLESLQYFQRYQRLENSPVANVEVRIAITYLSMLPDSPLFDGEVVGDSYRRIKLELRPEWHLHQGIRLMLVALESFLSMQSRLVALERANADLQTQLRIREEAITRLRDLTLGRDPE